MIEVIDNNVFMGEHVHITTNHKWCECSLNDMQPQYAVNLIFRATHQLRTCLNCNGVVSEQQNQDYNQYHGFSGYDEVDDDN